MIEELYRELYGPLSRWCAHMARDPTEGEDICQEAFLRALRHWGDLEGLSQEQRKSWLYKTAKNLYIDRLRRGARECLLEDAAAGQGSPTGEAGGGLVPAWHDDLSQEETAQLVGRLPPEERRLFVLRYFRGYNASELGERFDLPPATVRSRLLSARRRMAGWLAEER